MANKPQVYSNHARFDPLFHFFLAPAGLILLIGAIVDLVRHFGWGSGWNALAAFTGFLAIFKIRLYALKVQDRVIRLEERLRLAQTLPEALRPRIGELTEKQLIGLRFACDTEVPGLVGKTLSGNWEQKQIKKAIQTWRPDEWRV